MRLVLIGATLLTACNDKPFPIQIEKYCVSETGLSKYWLNLNTSERRGEIRYQYMSQDVRYLITNMHLDEGKISGRADFHASLTGETRGNPIIFSYESDTDTLKDGNTSAVCQNSQGTAKN